MRAQFHLRSDDLVEVLNRHFGLDNLNEASLKQQADGCTTAALLLMNCCDAPSADQCWALVVWDQRPIRGEERCQCCASSDLGVVPNTSHTTFNQLSNQALEVIREIENTR